jgi:large subunit ribosomal protein L15
MNIHDVHRGIEKHKKRTRVGRGIGSGHGKTAGRGGKGQTARAGYKALSIFEGGGMPLVRRIPKRGFFNAFAATVVPVNVGELEAAYNAGDEVTPESLDAKGLVKGRFDEVKILGMGELTKNLTVRCHKFSKSAREKIEKAGGSVVELTPPSPAAEKSKETKS